MAKPQMPQYRIINIWLIDYAEVDAATTPVTVFILIQIANFLIFHYHQSTFNYFHNFISNWITIAQRIQYA